MLIVCTANIARSPLAEVLLRGHVADRGLDGEVVVASAGRRARPGDAAAEHSAAIAAAWGLDLSGHRSRPADPELVEAADLVITMSEDQRDELASRSAGAGTRTFTLKELVRLLDGVDAHALPPAGAARLVAATLAAHRRRPFSPSARHLEDVDDPYGRSYRHYVVMANELNALFDAAVPMLLGWRPA